MQFNNILLLRDTRSKGLSVSVVITIGDYVNWYQAYGQENKLDEQRPLLRTRSANMIRHRLIEDLKDGAVIPPIVIGFTTDADLDYINEENIERLIEANMPISTVIDGMQRSGALLEAVQNKPEIAASQLRVDIWIANSTIALVYRMLVLNTGQTPWDVKRQMEVIYKPLIAETRIQVPGITINERNDGRRRTRGGEYPANSIVELFIAFSSRKEVVNPADRIADDFTRLDITQMAGEAEFSSLFFCAIRMMMVFDVAISRYRDENGAEGDGVKFVNGMDVFTQMPAKIGFVVALALEVIGRAGSTERSDEEKVNRLRRVEHNFNGFIDRLNGMDNNGLGEFLQIGILNETINSLPTKKIGNAQREYFRKGFSALIDSQFGVENLSVVWRAY